MKIPFYTSTRDFNINKIEYIDALKSVMEVGDFILGSEVKKFEEEVAAYLGVKYAVGVASGSDALTIGADILNFTAGAEVITPTFTFLASASCIARTGGKPVFVDMDEETFNIDLEKVESLISTNTKGILPVHLFLQPVEMQKVTELALRYNLNVLEDSAEAFGMKCLVNGKWESAGCIGAVGVYSFFPTKTLGAYGDAGLMVTNDEYLYNKIKAYRVHGAVEKYNYKYIGYNSRLDTLQASILRVKLRNIDDAIKMRQHHAKHYIELLSDIPQIRFPLVKDGVKEVYYVFNILTENRDELQNKLKEAGVGTSVYYPKPLHLQECFSYLGYKEGDFPIAEKICKEILALPMYPELKDDEVDFICDVIRKFHE